MNKTENSYSDLKTLINHMQLLYLEINERWQKAEKTKINLKKTTVSEISRDSSKYKLIVKYANFLNNISAEIIDKISLPISSQITSRVKTSNSIASKMQNYQSQQHAFGKIPVNKCFNDLLGPRVILKNPLSHKEICEFMQKTYQNEYKCVDSSKGHYTATHIYFKKDNFSFQWELQVWNSCDKEQNLKSHFEYKQGYTKWEHKAKQGRIK